MSSELKDEEKAALFSRMATHWQNKEWRQCADLFTEGGVLHSVMKEPLVGREAFYDRMLQLATPNKSVRLHIHRMGVIDGALIVERTDEVIVDGVSRSVPVMAVIEFEGEQIARWSDYYDRGQLLWAQGRNAPMEPVRYDPPAAKME